MESLFERRRPIKKRSPENRKEERVVFRDEQTRKAVALIVPAAALTLMPKAAHATQEVEFGPDVNNISSDLAIPEAIAAQLIPGTAPTRFTMTFGANDPVGMGYDVYNGEFELADGANSAVILKQLGEVTSDPDASDLQEDEGYLLKVDRGDGSVTKILNSFSNLIMDGQTRWGDGTSCNSLHITGVINPDPTNQNVIMIPAYIPVPRWPSRDDSNMWRVDWTQPGDFCVQIQDAIAAADAQGLDPYEAGLLHPIESSSSDEWRVAETLDLMAANRIRLDGSRPTHLLGKDPVTGTWKYLRHPTTNDTWVQENPQQAIPDSFGDGVHALLERQTPSGRNVTVLVYGTDGAREGSTVLRARILEKRADGVTWDERPVTMETSTTAPDDDGDGIENNLDNAPGRANPGQVDVTGPTGTADGIGDAAQADCTGNFPGVDQPGAVNSSGLRICQTSELGYAYVFSLEDGSTIHSNMDVVYSNNTIHGKSGQELRFIHSKDPRVAGRPAPNIEVASGNSVKFRLFETSQLDGSPGTVTFTHNPYETPAATETYSFTDPVTDWQEYDAGIGDVMGLEGCDVWMVIGSENLPLTCTQNPALCPVPDGGSDGGSASDAGTGGTDSGNSTDSGVPADGGGSEDAGESDSGTSSTDSGSSEDAGTDSGPTGSDSGTAEDSGTAGGDSGAGEDAGAREDAGPSTDSGNSETDAGNHGSPDSGGTEDAGEIGQTDGGQDAGRTGTDGGEATDAASTQDSGQPAADSGNLPDGGPKADQDAGRTGHNNDGNGNNENPDPGGCGCEIQAPNTQSCSIQAPDQQNHAPLATMDVSLGMLGALALAGTRQSVRRRIGRMWESFTT